MNTPEAHARIKAVLAQHRATPSLEAAIMREVEAFFAAHPEEPRTEFSVSVIAGIVLERLDDQTPVQEPALTRRHAE